MGSGGEGVERHQYATGPSQHCLLYCQLTNFVNKQNKQTSGLPRPQPPPHLLGKLDDDLRDALVELHLRVRLLLLQRVLDVVVRVRLPLEQPVHLRGWAGGRAGTEGEGVSERNICDLLQPPTALCIMILQTRRKNNTCKARKQIFIMFKNIKCLK